MIKVSDYIVKQLVEYGVRRIHDIERRIAITVIRSAAMGTAYICNHHEQASSMAVQAMHVFQGNSL